MKITNWEGLHYWFMNQKRGTRLQTEGEDAGNESPHWNLYSAQYGKAETRVASNTRIDNMDESFKFLKQTIQYLNNPNGAEFRLQVFEPGKPNNPTAAVLISIFDPSAAGSANAVQPGIGFLPGAGAGITEEELQRRLDEQKKAIEYEHRIAALEAQLKEPAPDPWMGFFERIAQTPAGAAIVQMVAAKFGGSPVPMSTPVNGLHNAPAPASDGQDELDEQDEQFYNNIGQTADMLGITPLELSQRLHTLVAQNPELAKTMIQ